MTRSHADIINDANGVSAFARAIDVKPNTVKPWRRLNSIPAPYWRAVVQAGLASLDELADAAEHRRQANTDTAVAA